MQILASLRGDLRHGLVRLVYVLQTYGLARGPLSSLRLRWTAPLPILWRRWVYSLQADDISVGPKLLCGLWVCRHAGRAPC